ncbi:MAG: endonuclease NucS [Thermofilum sp.]|uniref:Endonuclease NucS n=1 Tax=Thermofilum pendens TaxID=2269 RepID=A0A7C4D262_THEPE
MRRRWSYLRISEAAERIAEAVTQRKLIVMLASCTVSYEGRTVSRLGEGERLIIVKPDGCTLVHRPYGSLPVNYQPEGSLVSVKREEGSLVIVSARAKPSEKLVIRVTRVLHLITAEVVDNAEFEVGGSEREIRDAIAEAAELLLGEKLKSVEVEAKLSGAGFADLLMVDEQGNFVVVEVKRDKADVEAVYQLKRYVEHMRGAVGPRVRGILAAPSISRKALTVLAREGLEYRRLNLRRLVKVREGLTRFLVEEGYGGDAGGGGVHGL